MSNGFTIPELQQTITTLKAAFQRAAESGGVTSYTLKSGQGETTVHQGSLAEITSQIKIYSNLLNELVAIETGSSFTVITSMGL